MKLLRNSLVVTCMLALAALPAAAQAGRVTCKDGTKSAGGRGACSGHGGVGAATTKAEVKADTKVARAEKKAEVKAERAEKKADATVAKTEKKADRKAAEIAAKDDDRDARGATAECKDHTYSHAKTHQGACSRHGGVAKFIGK
jgi:vacuolar-type H+-ATPase subunit H